MTTYDNLPDNTRVWIYQSNRALTNDEVEAVQGSLNDFTTQWVSHNRQLRAYGDVLYQHFIVLMVDESNAGASGCSIDSSVHYVQDLQRQLGVDFFDRMVFAWKENEEVKIAQRDEFARLYKEGKINDDTLVFDNLVNTKSDFESQWVKPLKSSWHTRMV